MDFPPIESLERDILSLSLTVRGGLPLSDLVGRDFRDVFGLDFEQVMQFYGYKSAEDFIGCFTESLVLLPAEEAAEYLGTEWPPQAPRSKDRHSDREWSEADSEARTLDPKEIMIVPLKRDETEHIRKMISKQIASRPARIGGSLKNPAVSGFSHQFGASLSPTTDGDTKAEQIIQELKPSLVIQIEDQPSAAPHGSDGAIASGPAVGSRIRDDTESGARGQSNGPTQRFAQFSAIQPQMHSSQQRSEPRRVENKADQEFRLELELIFSSLQEQSWECVVLSLSQLRDTYAQIFEKFLPEHSVSRIKQMSNAFQVVTDEEGNSLISLARDSPEGSIGAAGDNWSNTSTTAVNNPPPSTESQTGNIDYGEEDCPGNCREDSCPLLSFDSEPRLCGLTDGAATGECILARDQEPVASCAAGAGSLLDCSPDELADQLAGLTTGKEVNFDLDSTHSENGEEPELEEFGDPPEYLSSGSSYQSLEEESQLGASSDNTFFVTATSGSLQSGIEAVASCSETGEIDDTEIADMSSAGTVATMNESRPKEGKICLIEDAPRLSKSKLPRRMKLPEDVWPKVYSLMYFYANKETGDVISYSALKLLYTQVFKGILEEKEWNSGSRLFFEYLQEWVDAKTDVMGTPLGQLRDTPKEEKLCKVTSVMDANQGKCKDVLKKHPLTLELSEQEDIDQDETDMETIVRRLPPPPPELVPSMNGEDFLHWRKLIYYAVLRHFGSEVMVTDNSTVGHLCLKKYKKNINASIFGVSWQQLLQYNLQDIIIYDKKSPVHGVVRVRLDIDVKIPKTLLMKVGLLDEYNQKQRERKDRMALEPACDAPPPARAPQPDTMSISEGYGPPAQRTEEQRPSLSSSDASTADTSLSRAVFSGPPPAAQSFQSIATTNSTNTSANSRGRGYARQLLKPTAAPGVSGGGRGPRGPPGRRPPDAPVVSKLEQYGQLVKKEGNQNVYKCDIGEWKVATGTPQTSTTVNISPSSDEQSAQAPRRNGLENGHIAGESVEEQFARILGGASAASSVSSTVIFGDVSPPPFEELVWRVMGSPELREKTNGVTLEEFEDALEVEFIRKNYARTKYPVDVLGQLKHVDGIQVYMKSGEDIWICSTRDSPDPDEVDDYRVVSGILLSGQSVVEQQMRPDETANGNSSSMSLSSTNNENLPQAAAPRRSMFPNSDFLARQVEQNNRTNERLELATEIGAFRMAQNLAERTEEEKRATAESRRVTQYLKAMSLLKERAASENGCLLEDLSVLYTDRVLRSGNPEGLEETLDAQMMEDIKDQVFNEDGDGMFTVDFDAENGDFLVKLKPGIIM